MKKKGITLIALVITIVILLILAGISIAALGGENGLIAKVTIAKRASIKAEMREQLVLALTELQVEKKGETTLDDVTQDWVDNTLEKYEPLLKDDASTSGKKITMFRSGVIGRYIIDENLNIVETDEIDSTIEFSYEAFEIVDNKVNILIYVRDRENGLTEVGFSDGDALIMNGTKEEKAIDYKVELGKEYKIKIISKSGEEREEIILIEDYWYKITKNLSQGIIIDNLAIKAAYNKPYSATLTTDGEYVFDVFTVTMGGQPVTTSGNNIVDVSTGKIYIERVTGNIEITITSKKNVIETTDAYIGTRTTVTDASESVPDNSQTRGEKLYINFTATAKITGATCTVSPNLPYAIIQNGTYKFTVTVTDGSYIEMIEKEVVVNKYESALNVVKYDAGEWTKDEIEELKKLSLYNINTSKKASSTFGLNFTFGGFAYRGDVENLDYINDGTVITSRNQSVDPQSNNGISRYNGWQILEIKDNNGNIITSETEINKKLANLANEKVYVTKLVHAGSPENFVYCNTEVSGDPQRAVYILSSGKKYNNFNTYKPRNWDMYIDKNQKELIKEVHAMEYEEAPEKGNSLRYISSSYWLATVGTGRYLRYLQDEAHDWGDGWLDRCYGIRPVITLKDGVYIASGYGVVGNEYVLAKE